MPALTGLEDGVGVGALGLVGGDGDHALLVHAVDRAEHVRRQARHALAQLDELTHEDFHARLRARRRSCPARPAEAVFL